MRTLVTGGLGHVGSAIVHALTLGRHQVVIVDDGRSAISNFQDLCTHRTPIESEATAELMRDYRPEIVFHFAASVKVEEGERAPLEYVENNVGAFSAFLRNMLASGCRKIIHSGTSAVYGIPIKVPVGEEHPTAPSSWYGWTKLLAEKMVDALSRSDGLQYMAFRYFNVAGSLDGVKERADKEGRLLPNAVQAAVRGTPFLIHGIDYPTRDGTCVRDYVHIMDVADAHVRAMMWLADRNVPGGAVVNLGTGKGHTVLEVIRAVEKVVGRPVRAEAGPRRPGDIPEITASRALAERLLGWAPSRDLDEAVLSTQKAMTS